MLCWGKMNEGYTGLSCTFFFGNFLWIYNYVPQKVFFFKKKKGNQVAIPGIVLDVEDRVKSKAESRSYLVSLRKVCGDWPWFSWLLEQARNLNKALWASWWALLTLETSLPTTLCLHSLPSSHACLPRCPSMQQPSSMTHPPTHPPLSSLPWVLDLLRPLVTGSPTTLNLFSRGAMDLIFPIKLQESMFSLLMIKVLAPHTVAGT